MDCQLCGKTIQEDEPCYQIRWGNRGVDEDFETEEVVAYHCQECGVETRETAVSR